MQINPNDKVWDDKIVQSVALPDGEYVVFISDAKVDVSKGGTKNIEIEFTVHDPASKFRGKSLRFQRFWLTEKALPRLVSLLRAAGVNHAFNAESEKEVEGALLDKILRIKVSTKNEEYNGEKRQKTEAGFFAKITAADRSRLVEEYGPEMLPPVDGSAPGEPAAPGGFNDDDIPF